MAECVAMWKREGRQSEVVRVTAQPLPDGFRAVRTAVAETLHVHCSSLRELRAGDAERAVTFQQILDNPVYSPVEHARARAELYFIARHAPAVGMQPLPPRSPWRPFGR